MVFPIHYLASLPVRSGRQIVDWIASRHSLLDDNQRLRNRLLANHGRILKYAALKKENQRLRNLLGSRNRLQHDVYETLTPVALVAVNIDASEHLILIDKGKFSGIKPGQPVLDSHGIIGQVARVNPFTAMVNLITNPEHSIPVQINRNGERTIAVGSGEKGRLNLPYLVNNADIQTGDLLVTSGFGEVFPKGYPVAKVETVQHNRKHPFATITAVATAKLNSGREFLVMSVDSRANPDATAISKDNGNATK